MEILGEFSNGVLGISKLNFWGWNFWDPGMEFWGNNWEFGDFRVFWDLGAEFWGILGLEFLGILGNLWNLGMEFLGI